MSFNNIPSKMEVMNWDPAHLADFLRRRELTGCDKVIMKCNMNGQRFLNMTENDLQKFPNLYSPIISKICREINKKEEKRSIFPKRNPAPKFQETVEVGHDEQGWDSEEFESDDYESPDSHDEGGGSGDYESATEAGGESDNDYEPPPSEPSDDLQHPHIRPSKPIGNSEYIDRPGTSVKSQPPVPPARPGPGPPLPTTGRPSIPGGFKRTDHSPQRPQKPPPPDRSKKPSTLERGSNLMPVQGENFTSERNAPLPKRPGGVDKFPDPQRMPKPPVPGLGGTGVRRAVSSVTPGHSYNSRHAPNPRLEFHDDSVRPSSNTFPLHSRNPSPRPPLHGHGGQPESIPHSGSLPLRLQEAMNSNRGSSRGLPQQPMRPPDPEIFDEQGMDSAWYVGQVSRAQAEGNLRHVNRDGAFLVRDSSKGSAAQPYTLMVLFQGKVFNIQIRKEQHGYILGTGLKSSERFTTVGDIIRQHTQMPLLLIDAKNRGSGQQNQCALTHPAGF
ncbi:lymphocyte cytosolic protein 2a isoform X1 [Astyanax mexicanus]|uniref:lymphocyte cytosolic protein 2a isoform X1 n=1 Tax=Astyanax mexicanus TaxID=7994 RepID=UPI0020CB1F53|nr:lymphocyte cytosolic protein 2a isoform X1 [Astyanax mexicanus]